MIPAFQRGLGWAWIFWKVATNNKQQGTKGVVPRKHNTGAPKDFWSWGFQNCGSSFWMNHIGRNLISQSGFLFLHLYWYLRTVQDEIRTYNGYDKPTLMYETRFLVWPEFLPLSLCYLRAAFFAVCCQVSQQSFQRVLLHFVCTAAVKMNMSSIGHQRLGGIAIRRKNILQMKSPWSFIRCHSAFANVIEAPHGSGSTRTLPTHPPCHPSLQVKIRFIIPKCHPRINMSPPSDVSPTQMSPHPMDM